MESSIFTKIIQGEIPCHKVFEDDKTFAFLDINPVAPGHTLVIPKKQVEFVWDLDEDTYEALQRTVHVVARRQRTVLQVPYVGQQIIGVDVPHAHIHLIPFSTVEEFRHQPDTSQEPDHDQLARIADRLRIS